jgi:hypothetical protein
MIGLGWALPWYVRWPLRVAFALDDAISWIRSRKRSGG